MGDVELRKVSFRYPARPQVSIFENFSIHVSAGTILALVGQSGSGKCGFSPSIFFQLIATL